MRINTNVSALNTHRILSQTNDSVARSIGRLSSGFRINSARDDAAGLAIANRFGADVRSLRVAQQNTTEANAMLQVAEGNTSTISDILSRMKELATQAASYNAESQTDKLDQEFQYLKSEIDRIVGSANYQGVALLDGSFESTFQIGAANDGDDQLGISLNNGVASKIANLEASDLQGIDSLVWDADFLADADLGNYEISVSTSGTDLTFEITRDGTTIATGTGEAGEEITLKTSADDNVATLAVANDFGAPTDWGQGFSIEESMGGLGTTDLGLAEIGLSNNESAQEALTAIDGAIDTVNSFLGTIGATQNRLEYAAANIATTVENYSASESAIRDADMAFEMVNFTRNQIMQQAATAMLAQANFAPQSVLQLLG